MTIGPSFDGVLQAARTGAEWAWTALYRDLAPVILGYLRAHGAAEPEDVASEVFLATVRNLNTFTGDEDRFRAWVFVIVHRRLQDDRRHRSRHPVDPAPDAWLDSATGNVEDEALTAVETQKIAATFAQLSVDQRDVLLMRVVADLSIDQIAEVMDKSQGAVKALQRRGIEAARRVVDREGVPL